MKESLKYVEFVTFYVMYNHCSKLSLMVDNAHSTTSGTDFARALEKETDE